MQNSQRFLNSGFRASPGPRMPSCQIRTPAFKIRQIRILGLQNITNSYSRLTKYDRFAFRPTKYDKFEFSAYTIRQTRILGLQHMTDSHSRLVNRTNLNKFIVPAGNIGQIYTNSISRPAAWSNLNKCALPADNICQT